MKICQNEKQDTSSEKNSSQRIEIKTKHKKEGNVKNKIYLTIN